MGLMVIIVFIFLLLLKYDNCRGFSPPAVCGPMINRMPGVRGPGMRQNIRVPEKKDTERPQKQEHQRGLGI